MAADADEKLLAIIDQLNAIFPQDLVEYYSPGCVICLCVEVSVAHNVFVCTFMCDAFATVDTRSVFTSNTLATARKRRRRLEVNEISGCGFSLHGGHFSSAQVLQLPFSLIQNCGTEPCENNYLEDTER